MIANLTEQHHDDSATTLVAAALNYAMARDAAARERYLAIYGEEWAPLGDGSEILHRRATISSEARTRLAKGSR